MTSFLWLPRQICSLKSETAEVAWLGQLLPLFAVLRLTLSVHFFHVGYSHPRSEATPVEPLLLQLWTIVRGTMLPMASHLTSLCLVFCLGSGLATPLPSFSLLEGSTDEEELTNSTSPLTYLVFSTSEYQTTPASPTHVETEFLSQVKDFMEENMLLILVASSFILLFFLIVCGAIFMSRRRKVNAYYPSSFPSKMYVDHRDKTGGAKLFNEVPEKAAPEQEVQIVDSHKQLQADIMRAAKSLRTPNKSAAAAVAAADGGDPSQKEADQSPEACSKQEGSILDQQLSSLPEETEPCELPESEKAAAGCTELKPPEQQDDDSKEPLTGTSLRPPSLHIHNDSATLQLIAGEKTAF
ncbi:transmembrane protein 119b [Xyrichtys novacula]|uniref:Transmembrane protein 119b n=1 Tax=Xyrichtys novacula TaxID=13765 RepID=A0AAV1G941_XYRNO|nr:transmembrane protein 119b [Xyrichtys novacula]